MIHQFMIVSQIMIILTNYVIRLLTLKNTSEQFNCILPYFKICMFCVPSQTNKHLKNVCIIKLSMELKNGIELLVGHTVFFLSYWKQAKYCLINNSRTPWLTWILMLLLSSLDIYYKMHIQFVKKVFIILIIK